MSGTNITVGGGGSVNSQDTDIIGNVLPLVTRVAALPNVYWNNYNFADLFLSREPGTWGGAIIEQAVKDLVTDLINAGLWTKIISLHPRVGSTANNHRWNLKYPFNNRQSFSEIYSGTSHDNKGVIFAGAGMYKTAFVNPLVEAPSNSFTYGFFQTREFVNNADITNQTVLEATYANRGCQLSVRPSDGRIIWGIGENVTMNSYVPGSVPLSYIGRHTTMTRNLSSGANAEKLFINGVAVQSSANIAVDLEVFGRIYSTNIKTTAGSPIIAGMSYLFTTIGTDYTAVGLSDAEVAALDSIIANFENIVR
jgi:hypothetical protein